MTALTSMPAPAADVSPVDRSRIGSVPYLNAAPLVHGLGPEVRLAPPSRLARMLRASEVDAGLVSVTEVLETDLYDVVDDVGVCCNGPVYSVLLAHRVPRQQLRRIALDPASLTSVRLLQLLLAEDGLRPEFVPLTGSTATTDEDGFLLIGDAAIKFRQSPAAGGYEIWDLGQAWKALTHLPFVFAVWAIRRDAPVISIALELIRAKAAGVAALDSIIQSRPEFDLATREAYLRRHLRYDIREPEHRAVGDFAARLERHGITQTRPVQWIAP
jgi:chorismate dehydratase